MSEITECPACGGPVIDAGGIDVRCGDCGATFQDFFEISDTEEMAERLQELGIDVLGIDADEYFDDF